MGKLIAKIALTGGPCAGKTTTISRIEEHLTDLGYHVITLNECATEIIRNGIRPFGNNAVGVYEFENEILNLQLFKEKRFKDFIKYYPDDTKIVFLCDRGSVDVCAYLGKENYERMLKENNLKHEDLLNDYDLVIHMITVAANRENKFSNSNNKARFEDNEEEAINVDNNIKEAWKDYKNLKVAPVCDYLEDKIQIAINYVDELLKEKDQ
jgi:thymidylate kinase